MFEKKYFQDRPILFLNLLVICSSLINVIAPLAWINTSKSLAIVRYIAALDIAGYIRRDADELYSFAVFAVIVALVAVLVSARLYTLKRELSLMLLALTAIVLLFNLIVSSAILNLQ